LTSINGLSVIDRQRSISQIAEIFPGKPVELVVQRKNQTFTIHTTAGERPSLN
jgi:S1-C subfamily serine protease